MQVDIKGLICNEKPVVQDGYSPFIRGAQGLYEWREEETRVVLIINILPGYEGRRPDGHDPGLLAKLSSQILFPVFVLSSQHTLYLFPAAVCYFLRTSTKW